MGRASAGKAFTIDAKNHLIYRCRWDRIDCRRPPPIAILEAFMLVMGDKPSLEMIVFAVAAIIMSVATKVPSKSDSSGDDD